MDRNNRGRLNISEISSTYAIYFPSNLWSNLQHSCSNQRPRLWFQYIRKREVRGIPTQNIAEYNELLSLLPQNLQVRTVRLEHAPDEYLSKLCLLNFLHLFGLFPLFLFKLIFINIYILLKYIKNFVFYLHFLPKKCPFLNFSKKMSSINNCPKIMKIIVIETRSYYIIHSLTAITFTKSNIWYKRHKTKNLMTNMHNLVKKNTIDAKCYQSIHLCPKWIIILLIWIKLFFRNVH